MKGWGTVVDANFVTWALLSIIALSLYQGIRRGASGSVRRLASFLGETLLTVLAVVLAAIAASELSPRLQEWLAERSIARPSPDSSALSQFFYTAVTGLRDLPLLRFAALFLIVHTLVRLVAGLAARALLPGPASSSAFPSSSGGAVSRAAGGALGAALGAGRALLITAALFAYCALLPQGPLTDYIQQSGLYREVAAQIIRPAAGDVLEERLPVFAKAMSGELDQLWQKRYDVIDAELPEDIVQAALTVTKDREGDRAKARALYDWVGTRISYDDDKVRAYEDLGEWREQNPETTFVTRKGVCIDYSRLYASMARAVGLDVRVVTGLGYDGRGGYGAHAWNEVYSTEEKRWIPLDSTWAKTGNWFDPPGFADTHIRQGGVTG
ncbi:cysteine protease [Cohnella sp. CIP 111063]|uniref:transglutaminase domain-containing protein n=1 Tax=unclassified Cohnella TaxID=2636738 RepID=UPI000B8C1599|nr:MULTISPECIES: transglutaminase-like domain-containing protein [unclassified Cohnella]OXS53309.1 cysteine protease [Cohnella sp. CIP 111063]PRX61046.1 colicin V production protein [Cohnella sp. SGD-V74]